MPARDHILEGLLPTCRNQILLQGLGSCASLFATVSALFGFSYQVRGLVSREVNFRYSIGGLARYTIQSAYSVRELVSILISSAYDTAINPTKTQKETFDFIRKSDGTAKASKTSFFTARFRRKYYD